MAFCTNCGCELEPDATSCPACNAPALTGQGQDASRSTQPAPDASQIPQPGIRRPGKKTIAIAASVMACIMVLVACAITFSIGSCGAIGPFGQPGGGSIHKSSKDVSDTLYKVSFDLGSLVDGESNAAQLLDGTYDFELRGKKSITDSDHMALLVKYADYDVENPDQYKYLEEEVETTSIWHIQLSANKDDVGLDAVRKGASVNVAQFVGRHYGSEPSCEEAAEVVSELYGYNGIALYKRDTGDGGYTIEGSAINDKTVASISCYAYQHEGVSRITSYITTHRIDEDSIRFVKQFAHFCSADFQDFEFEDSFITDIDSATLKELISKHYDPAAFERELREKSRAIGSSFTVPFDLSDIVTTSTSATAPALGNLIEFKSTIYSEGKSKTQYHYAASVDAAAAMDLDVNGDSKADELQGTLDVAPWYLDMSDKDYNCLTASSVANGRTVSHAHFTGKAAVENPTCADVAKLIKPAYNYSRIVLHSNSYTGDIDGYAIEGDTVATIRGTNLTSWNKGIYYLDIYAYNSYDEGIGQVFKGNFDEEYRNDALRYSYAEVYFE